MKRSLLLIYAVAIIVLIAACGSGGGGGSERFSTVEVFASYDEGVYTADAELGEDTSDPPNGICNSFSVTSDDVIATVTSTAFEPLPEGVNPSAVNILWYLVEYIPRTPDTPDLAAKRLNQQINIPAPGLLGSVAQEVIIRLFDISDKRYLNPLFAVSPATEFKYTAKVKLRMEEVATGIAETVEFKFSVRYFNVATDECAYP
jgi:hypothetical protein